MKAFLVIIFIINGEPSINFDGHAPLEMELENCEQSVEFTLNYFNSIPTQTEVYGVYCNTLEELEKEFDIIFNSEPT